MASKSRTEGKKSGENSVLPEIHKQTFLFEYNCGYYKSMISNSSHITFSLLIMPIFYLVMCTREKKWVKFILTVINSQKK